MKSSPSPWGYTPDLPEGYDTQSDILSCKVDSNQVWLKSVHVFKKKGF